MSLFDALSTAVAGLQAQELAIGNISANVANAQTVGYKSIGTNFESLVLYNGGFQEPGSVLATTENYNDVSGTLIASQEATNLAINGNGFFVVKAAPAVTSSGTDSFNAQDFYTRAGDFTVNKDGYLVNSAGYYLEGYGVNASTGATTGTAIAPIQVPESESQPQATSLVNLVANLPSDYPNESDSGYSAPSPVTTTIYDAQGNAQTVSVQFNKTATDTWTATISATGSVSPQANPVTLQIKFGDGTTKAPDGTTPAAGTLESITNISSPANTTAPTISTDTSGAAADVGLTFNFGGKNQAVSLDLGTWGGTSGLTSYSGSAVAVTSETQNGYTSGTINGISIDNNGYVNVAYTNGDTSKVAQVAVAQFADSDGLTSVNGTAFESSLDSGTAVVNAATEGQIAPSELEESTVSLSNELTRMITAQQVYTSNARVITTADQMLQTLTQTIQG